MRWSLLLLAVVLLSVTSCTKLPGQEDRFPADLASLDSIPADYGQLVAVTNAPQASGEVGWRELWFQNSETGRVTYVPALLPDWKYYPKMVKTIARP